jgi:hypothetical protein
MSRSVRRPSTRARAKLELTNDMIWTAMNELLKVQKKANLTPKQDDALRSKVYVRLDAAYDQIETILENLDD